MKLKTVVCVLLCAAFVSCGVKMNESEEDVVGLLNEYIVKVNENHSLSQTEVDGVLTSPDGSEDVGTFKYYVNYNKESKELCHIKNIEKTTDVRQEDYYFKNNKLVSVLVVSPSASDKKIYIHKGRIISSLNVDSKEQDLLLAKAKRFQNEYDKQL